METVTHAEFLATLIDRFGQDPMDWAFICPSCKDVATGADFKAALEAHPRESRGKPVVAEHVIGQECIGRSLGALNAADGAWGGRGCNWTAYGLFAGPLYVMVSTSERPVPSFHIAESVPA